MAAWPHRHAQGTAHYEAPEVGALGHASYASDIYAFGMLALELCSGRPMGHMGPSGPADPPPIPLQETHAPSLEHMQSAVQAQVLEALTSVPQPLCALIGACLHPVAAGRPNVRNVATILLQLLARLESVAPAPGP
jgi:serine/threonine protein kinase